MGAPLASLRSVIESGSSDSGMSELDRARILNATSSNSAELKWLRSELETVRQVCSDLAFERDTVQKEATLLRLQCEQLEEKLGLQQRRLWGVVPTLLWQAIRFGPHQLCARAPTATMLL